MTDNFDIGTTHDRLLLRGWHRAVLSEWPCMQGACKAIRKLEVGETLQSLEDFWICLDFTAKIVELPPLCVFCSYLCKFIVQACFSLMPALPQEPRQDESRSLTRIKAGS